MTLTRARVLLAIAMCVAPLVASAQRPAYAANLGGELDSATTAGVLGEVERASIRGLPTEPLLAKAREGRIKHAAGPRIRQAVSALAVRLDSARSALGPASTDDELVAGAEAIAAGAGPDALRALRAANARGSVSVPLGALAQLVASGVPLRRATAMVLDLLRRRVPAAQVVAFGNAVEGDAAGGLPAEEAALFRLRAVDGSRAATAANVATSPGSDAAATHPPALKGTTSPRRRP